MERKRRNIIKAIAVFIFFIAYTDGWQAIGSQSMAYLMETMNTMKQFRIKI